MTRTYETPQLPGDWSSVDQQAEELAQKRRMMQLRHQREELTRNFEDWLREEMEAEPDEVQSSTRMVREILRLKDLELDSPDPLEWTEDLLRAVVTETVPQKLPEGLGAPEVAAADLLHFVSFLAQTRQWRKRALPAYAATALFLSLAWPRGSAEFTVEIG